MFNIAGHWVNLVHFYKIAKFGLNLSPKDAKNWALFTLKREKEN